MGQRIEDQGLLDFRMNAKAKQATKLVEIREALVAAGCHTSAKQAVALGVSRPTAWALLNRAKRAGPSAHSIKRILSSPEPSAGSATKGGRVRRGEDRRLIRA